MKAILIAGLLLLCAGRSVGAMTAECVDGRKPTHEVEEKKVVREWLVSIGYYSITDLWGKPKGPPKHVDPPLRFTLAGSS